MRILCLCSYPIEAAATRFRVLQYVKPLSKRGIILDVRPFLDSSQFKRLYRGGNLLGKSLGMLKPLFHRGTDLLRLPKYDAIFVQREAMLFGPPVFESLGQTLGRLPLVLDLDDATYVAYDSPRHGKLASKLKFFGKTDSLIRRAEVVVCGNRNIADHVESLGSRAVVIPTVVNEDLFHPLDESDGPTVVGWIGTHSTFPFLQRLFPVLQRLAAEYAFVLKIIGAHERDVTVPGVEVINLDWSLEREVRDFQTLDIGLYPMSPTGSASREWILGKSGFKAIQYMSVGVPFVMSAVGDAQDVGRPGHTHFLAASDDEWYRALSELLASAELRRRMGSQGREFAVEEYSLAKQADKLAALLENVGQEKVSRSI